MCMNISNTEGSCPVFDMALKQEFESSQSIKAIIMTLWLVINYENRFEKEVPATNIYVHGIEGIPQFYITPLFQDQISRNAHASMLASTSLNTAKGAYSLLRDDRGVQLVTGMRQRMQITLLRRCSHAY